MDVHCVLHLLCYAGIFAFMGTLQIKKLCFVSFLSKPHGLILCVDCLHRCNAISCMNLHCNYSSATIVSSHHIILCGRNQFVPTSMSVYMWIITYAIALPGAWRFRKSNAQQVRRWEFRKDYSLERGNVTRSKALRSLARQC